MQDEKYILEGSEKELYIDNQQKGTVNELEYGPTCTAQQLVDHLKSLIAEHGNVPVYYCDNDTQYILPFNAHIAECDSNGQQFDTKFIEIYSTYTGIPTLAWWNK